MTKSEVLKKIENYVRREMPKPEEDKHDFRHANRVRIWAKKIGKAEKFDNMFILEVAALLHDIGRKNCQDGREHYELGRQRARAFLETLKYFSEKDIFHISQSIFEHGEGGRSKLTKILQDADRMDLWGAIGISRISEGFWKLPVYIDKDSFKFKKMSPVAIDLFCKDRSKTECILDRLNLNLNIYTTVNTVSAKKMATEKIKLIRTFMRQLRNEAVDI